MHDRIDSLNYITIVEDLKHILQVNEDAIRSEVVALMNFRRDSLKKIQVYMIYSSSLRSFQICILYYLIKAIAEQMI